MAISIFTDASSNLFASFLKEKESSIHVIPMPLRIGDKEYLCYDSSLDAESFSHDFYAKMREGATVKTSLPSPGLLEEEVRKEIEEGNQVAFITLSCGISGTYQSAKLIADSINEEKGSYLMAVIDSKTAGFGEGMIALYAENLAKLNYSLEDLVKSTEEYVMKVRSEFTVDSLKYLAATGRISKLNAALGNVLMIKPLLYGSEEGKITVTQKAIGRKNAIKKLLAQVEEYATDKTKKIYITHCDAPEEAFEMKAALMAKGFKDIEVYFYDLITGAHVGPGTLAVFYEGANRAIKKSLLP